MRCLPLLVLLPSLAFADRTPPPEVIDPGTPVELPKVPAFEMRASQGDLHAPRELVLVSRPLGKEVKAAGYVVAIYACAQIDVDPTQCERPKLWLGDTPSTRQDAALWVVDVPRPPNQLERERLPKEELDRWPVVPKVEVGDYVVVRGTFDVKSPHGEVNSDGIIVYAGIQKARPPREKLVAVPDAPPLALPRIDPPAPAPIDELHRRDSMKELNAANKLLGARDYDNAVLGYQKALALMPENHLASYGLGGAYAGKGEWAKAADAFAVSARIVPDAAMYQMWLGVSLYERARKDGTDHAVAREPLERAVKLEPRLWRADLYLGRLARDTGHPHAAAAWLTLAIENDPREVFPFVALAELYRRWGFQREAIETATLGIEHARGETKSIWTVLGFTYLDAKQYERAVAALTQAIDKGETWSYFGRAQAYRALGKNDKAKQDYEAYVKVGKGADEVRLAKQALLELR